MGVGATAGWSPRSSPADSAEGLRPLVRSRRLHALAPGGGPRDHLPQQHGQQGQYDVRAAPDHREEEVDPPLRRQRAWGRQLREPVSPPVVADGVVYVYVSAENTLHALDAATGAEKWKYTIGGGIWDLRAADGRAYVYVGHEEALHAFDAATGTRKWDSSGIGSTAAWSVVGKVHAFDIRAIDLATGRKSGTPPSGTPVECWRRTTC
ncbi:PQQ-binding-like beta-propeller repeat protein [Streptomyces sp. M19]